MWARDTESVYNTDKEWIRSHKEKKRGPGMEQGIFHIFIHSAVDRLLGCFHIPVVVNSAAMNIEMQVSF